jgi:hypothetical protein
MSPSESAASMSSEASPVTGPPRALDLLLAALKNRSGRNAPEVRANICALLGQLGRPGVVDEADAARLAKMKHQAKPILEAAAATDRTSQGHTALATTAEKAIEGWA